MNLKTRYLGMELAHPLMPGASPMAENLDMVRRLEDAGASAIVMNSLFEEQIRNEAFRDVQDVDAPSESYYEALTYHPRQEDYLAADSERYVERIRKIKSAVSVPVIASLNGVSCGTWLRYARQCEQAGADALELNVYLLATDRDTSGSVVENSVIDVARTVRESVDIPVAVKLSPFFSSIPHLLRRIDETGCRGAVLFNRFYQPDIDIDNLEILPTLHLSDSSELLLRLRWLAILSGQTRLSLAITGGVHTATDAVKSIMAGAHAIQMVSALLKNGPDHLKRVRQELAVWMEQHEYESVEEMRGSMNLSAAPDPAALGRGNYMRILQGGVRYV